MVYNSTKLCLLRRKLLHHLLKLLHNPYATL